MSDIPGTCFESNIFKADNAKISSSLKIGAFFVKNLIHSV